MDECKQLKGKILLGITGGVAVYKIAELTRLLVKQGYQVRVVMTNAAQKFVSPDLFELLSGQPVFTNLWDKEPHQKILHIELACWADLILVAPATAHCLSKTALGLADDLLSTILSARRCPLCMVPAMNREMWANLATQRQITQLQCDGVTLLGPEQGDQACGDWGTGRMMEPKDILLAMNAFFRPQDLVGKTVLITAGPTHEAIDPVRMLTNHSSGKMGYALAAAAVRRGARVILVSGPTHLDPPRDCEVVSVVSAQEMWQAVALRYLKADYFFSVAAVADYTPVVHSQQKIKKSTDTLTLTLVPTLDILKTVANAERGPFCVGFCAETECLESYAVAKRLAKNVPMMVANLAQQTFGQDDNEILIVDESGVYPLARMSKMVLAEQIVDHAIRLAQGLNKIDAEKT